MEICTQNPYENHRVYGPYIRKDGRKHVMVVNELGKRTTVSYPKYVMEIKLGRKLDGFTETIDHIDNNFKNDSIENYQIISRSENAKKGVFRTVIVDDMACILCGELVSKRRLFNRHRNMSRKGHKPSGPFCSKKCSGTYGTLVQWGKCSRLEGKKVTVRYERMA